METRRKKTRRLFLDFLEQHGSVLLTNLDCETLGRLAAVSKRALAMNKTGGVFAQRWREAADALDENFEMPDFGECDVGDVEGVEEWCGRDPRVDASSLVWEATRRGRGYEKVTEASQKSVVEAWKAKDPMVRVATVIDWQTKVADACRACPESYVAGFRLRIWDNSLAARFVGAYDFDADCCSPAMELVLRLGYIKCCEVSRCGRYCHASDVYVNGWDAPDFSSSSRRDFHWDMVTELFEDDDDDGQSGERTTPVVTKAKVLALCDNCSRVVGKPHLDPLLGERVCSTKLAICRGEGDLPAHWEYLFDDDDDDDDSDDGDIDELQLALAPLSG
mmetsp:Transcript_30150/g.92233  ORF Transcript_30150/g.92233 Transcript_30150/m.92233 type:complete len:334 (+) Transcript_30150:210-1211(+)